MSADVPALAEALRSLLPDNLSPEQRERFGAIAAIVEATTSRVPHARDEFVEPAAIVDLQVRLAGEPAAGA